MGGKKNPLVSIGIPTYNRADGNLRRVIERSLGQTYANVEVIVSDNCSCDHTPKLVRSIADPRLRYFRQEKNIGPNNNFNFCLKQARGEYFLLLHDDDMIDEDFVEAAIASLKPDECVGAIFTGVRVIDEHDNVVEEHPNNAMEGSAADFVRGWFRGTTTLYLCNTLYNTDNLREIGGFHSKKNLYDDLVPTFTLVAKYGRADLRDIKAAFRRHGGNRGATVSIHDWIEDGLYLLDVLYRLAPAERDILSEEGRRYLCRIMYWKASGGIAVVHSPLDYLRIYRAFDYCLSPFGYFYRNKLRRHLRRKMRALLAHEQRNPR